MREFFLSEENPFTTFCIEHQRILLVFLVFSICIIFFARKYLSEKQQTLLGTGLALLTTFGVISRMIILSQLDQFSYQDELPLYICRIVTFFVPFLMFYRNKMMFGILYFWILAGTLNAILTPDLQFGFPHFTSWIYWILHCGLVLVILYAVFVYKMRPRAKDIVLAFFAGNVYILSIHFINVLLGSNYSYTMQKPQVASLLDFMGPWPWYLINGQLLAVVLFVILFLPFWIQSRILKLE